MGAFHPGRGSDSGACWRLLARSALRTLKLQTARALRLSSSSTCCRSWTASALPEMSVQISVFKAGKSRKSCSGGGRLLEQAAGTYVSCRKHLYLRTVGRTCASQSGGLCIVVSCHNWITSSRCMPWRCGRLSEHYEYILWPREVPAWTRKSHLSCT